MLWNPKKGKLILLSASTYPHSPSPELLGRFGPLPQWLASRCSIMAMVVTMRMRQITQKKSRSTTLPSAFHSSMMWVSASSCFILSVMKRRFCRISSSVESPADQKTVQELGLKAATINEKLGSGNSTRCLERWREGSFCGPSTCECKIQINSLV